MLTLAGRNCIFAGATGGDGTCAVHALCAAGMNVAMMSHQLTQAQNFLNEVESCKYPGRCIAVSDGDTRDIPVTEKEIYREIYEKFGSIDVIICNTGGDGFEDSIDSVNPEGLMREVKSLLGASYSMLYNALPYLRESCAPRVIFMTTSECARGGRLESFANAVAKGAVQSLAKNCAARLAKDKITVNCIAKGAIERIRHGNSAPDGRLFKDTSVMLPYIPAGRMGTPKDLSAAICFLASEESAYVTGTVLDVSGGLQLV